MVEFKSGMNLAWVQPDGPNTEVYPLACHGLPDITKPKGDITLGYCMDISGVNEWRSNVQWKGEPGAITATVTTQQTDLLDRMELIDEQECEFPLYVHGTVSGRRDVFGNYGRGNLLLNTQITNESDTNEVARTPNEQGETLQGWDVAAPTYVKYFQFTITRETTDETDSLNDVSVNLWNRCPEGDGGILHPGDQGLITADHLAGSASAVANVVQQDPTIAAVGTWTALAGPFAAGEDVGPGIKILIGPNTERWIVGCATTDAGAPAKIQYSDDKGITWSAAVEVGSTNGQFFTKGKTIFAASPNAIWAVTSGGYIYFSADQGLTWTAQEEGTITAGDYFCVHAVNENVCYAGAAADIIAYTINGGTTWTQAAATGDGGDILSIGVKSQYRIWCGTDDGQMYYTFSGGLIAGSWAERLFTGSGVGEVRDIVWLPWYPANMYIGLMIHDDASPVGTVFKTVNGGFTWDAIATPTNVGLNALAWVNAHYAYVVGEAQGGTGFVARVYGG